MVNNAFIKKLWSWFDNYFLLAGVAFLIVFIPLYPKIPLADILPGYIVRIRLEDIFIAFFGLWWGVQALRRKVHWRTPLTWFVLAYAVTGLLSNVLGVYLTQTIPAELLHFGKSSLHWLRYLQYFSLFFLAYGAVKTRRQAQWLIAIMVVTLFGVVLYGYGQKNWYWPVYSTMNREFSKGIRLYLGPFARVQSTFAGHYDLGGYLVIVTPLLWSLAFAYKERVKDLKKTSLQVWKRKNWWWTLTLAVGVFAGLWLLVLSASRTSFVGYAVGVGLVTFLYWVQRRRSLWWFITRTLFIGGISFIMLFTVGDLSDRFAQLIDVNKNPRLHNAYHTANNYLKNPEQLIGLNFEKQGPPDGAKSIEDLEKELNEQGMTKSDTQPTTQRPQDVYVDVPEKEYELDDPAATLAGELVEKDGKLVKERVFSDCSLNRSLSLCIRLETLWPQALDGFYANPLFGSGYATLTKATVEQFTEAESTDNNFLRTLGETGALGFFFFYGAIGITLWYHFQVFRTVKDDDWMFAVAVGAFGGTIGLLINALYIDVFAASKVAYTFWMLQGVLLGVYVKEGIVGHKYAFELQEKKEKTTQLSALLTQVEESAQKKTGKSQYLSTAKRRKKSTQRKKSVSKKK